MRLLGFMLRAFGCCVSLLRVVRSWDSFGARVYHRVAIHPPFVCVDVLCACIFECRFAFEARASHLFAFVLARPSLSLAFFASFLCVRAWMSVLRTCIPSVWMECKSEARWTSFFLRQAMESEMRAWRTCRRR